MEQPAATSPGPSGFPPPPPGLNYIAAIRPSLINLLINTSWSALLIPLLCILFVFSDSKLRRRPIFLINCISILVGIILGAIGMVEEVLAILSPTTPVPPAFLKTYGVLIVSSPIFTDFIPLFRVLAVYPPQLLTYRRLATIYLPIILFKIARITNLGFVLHKWFSAVAAGGNPIVLGQSIWNIPEAKIELFLEVFDNGFSSALFLRCVHKGWKAPGRINSQRSNASIYSTRLKYLFWLTISNFVFPVIFSIALIIFNFRDQNYLHGGYVYISNTYIQIICGLLATVWSGTHKWVESRDDGNSKATATTSTGVINVELRDLDSRPSGSFGRSLNVPIWKKEEGKPLY